MTNVTEAPSKASCAGSRTERQRRRGPGGRGVGGAVLGALRRGALGALAVEVGRGQTNQRAWNREQRLPDVRVVAAWHREPVHYQADDHGADDRRDERADDPAPEVVRQEHGEVPDG